MKKIKKSQESSILWCQNCQSDITNLQEDLACLDLKDLDGKSFARLKSKYLSSVNPSSKQNTSKPSSPCLQFLGHNGCRYLVGRNAVENENLTRAARGNDWWFHVLGSQGSHVVVPRMHLKNSDLDETTIREAGMLALHYSVLRPHKNGEIQFAQRSNLKKRKPASLGQWEVLKSKNRTVSYTQNDLDQFFSRQK